MPIEQVDLVIPVYNEAVVLEESVRRLAGALDECIDFRWRIVIVDNASVDDTRLIGEELAAKQSYVRFLHLDRKGRGGALRHAWTETDADFSLYMDVDLSTDLEAVSRTVSHLRAGADIVTGSRVHPQSEVKRCLKREILSRGYIRLIKLSMGVRFIDDAQCGFKGIRLERVRPLLPLVKNQNWFFDTELLVLAGICGTWSRKYPHQMAGRCGLSRQHPLDHL